MRRALGPGCVTYHAWQAHQDTEIQNMEGHCLYYLERPVTAGRLSSNWDYKLLLGGPETIADQQILMRITKE